MSKTEDHARPTHQSEGVVWDLPLRLFHWLLVVTIAGSIISGKSENMFLHEKFGLTVAGLIAFRVIWGFVGSHHAQFSRFMVPPSALITYIKGRINGARDHRPGHAPTGAYATLMILLVLGVMAVLGMMSNDDVLYEGPLAAYVGSFSNMASSLHHDAEKAVFALIFLHLAAILIYRVVLGIRLVPDMIRGGTDPHVRPISRRHQIAGIGLMAALIAAMHMLSFLGDRII